MTLLHIGSGRIGKWLIGKLIKKVKEELGIDYVDLEVQDFKVSVHKGKLNVHFESDASMSIKDIIKLVKEEV